MALDFDFHVLFKLSKSQSEISTYAHTHVINTTYIHDLIQKSLPGRVRVRNIKSAEGTCHCFYVVNCTEGTCHCFYVVTFPAFM